MSSAPLRLFRGDPSDTITQLFGQLVRPKLEEIKATAGHIRESELHLERWRAWWQSRAAQETPQHTDRLSVCSLSPYSSGEIPALEVTPEDVIAWRQWLPKQKGLFPDGVSHRTLNKHVQTILSVLAAAADARRPGFVRFKVAKLAEGAAPKFYFTREQLDALYHAADAAEWPRIGDLSPGDFWRSTFVLFTNFGFRTQELVAFEPDHQPLLVGNFWWQPETPDPEGTAINSYGWLSYVPQKQKRKKPKPLYLPLNRCVQAHVQMVLSARDFKKGDRDPLFPIPHCNRSFYAAWQTILRAAKVRPKASLDGTPQDFELRHFRKTCTTWMNRHRPGIAPYITGHASRDTSSVSEIHYNNAELAVLEALQTFPQPMAFEKIYRATRQQSLF
jgi:integrase